MTKEKPIALFLIEANPPTFAIVNDVIIHLDKFSKIIVVVWDKPRVMPTSVSLNLLQRVFSLSDKIEVISHKADFGDIQSIPIDLPEHDVILTTSDFVYNNLVLNGMTNVISTSRISGWNQLYSRKAYQQSVSLDYFLDKGKQVKRIIK